MTAGRANADGSRLAIRDGFEIRRAAVERRIPCLTSLDTAAALVESLNLLALDGAFEVMTVDEYLRGPVVESPGVPEVEPEEAML
jgi:carbamoyl-phosphate synthase large subunit